MQGNLISEEFSAEGAAGECSENGKTFRELVEYWDGERKC
jgi:hypothetical protein